MKRALVLLCLAAAAAVPLAIASCSSGSSGGSPTPPPDAEPEGAVDTRPPTPPEWDRPVTRPDEAQAAADRAACKFARGALADETLGTQIPVGKDLPIDTIVVLMQENRSFDHYFGHLNQYMGRTDIESAPENASNPDRAGTTTGSHPWHRSDHLCFLDTNHEWDGSHTQYDDGKMDGFYETNHDFSGEVMPDAGSSLKTGERAMSWFDQKEIPFYYELAKQFAIGDHYFCSLLGPTWPNRMYLWAGTSFGQTDNFFPNIDAYPFPQQDAVILDELDKRHVDWKLYTNEGPPGVAVVVGVQLPTRWGRNVVGTMDDFRRDAAEGKLPPVVFLDANFLKTGDPAGEDEHPPSNPQLGQKFVHDIVKTLFASPQWKRLALFLMYDEHGGLYDHVPPPKACVPDDKTPIDEAAKPRPFAFDRYGMRVPFVVVSPYAKKGFVSHGVYDHTSVLRLIQAKHRVPALTGRDANAAIPVDMFDFQSPPNLVPPQIPEPGVDQAELDYCKSTFRR